MAAPAALGPLRPRLWVFALAALLLTGHVTLAYRGWLTHERWFALHLAIGWAWLAGLLGLAGLRWRHLANPRAIAVLLATALAICGFWYLGRLDSWQTHWEPLLPQTSPPQPPWGWARPVWGFAYFSLSAALFRIGVPAVVGKLLGLQPAELGWRRAAGGPTVWPVYLLLYVAVVPFVVHAAGTPAFQAKYPMARALIDSTHHIALAQFLGYQVLYALVFVSGELFWRGWICFGLQRDLGAYAILVMLVPYVFAHLGKPVAEVLGAIAAGTVLGWLALAHRSIWLGVLLHYAVALTMDGLAMQRADIGLRSTGSP